MRQLKITKQITKRESQSLEQYLQDIGRISLLSPDEEVEVAKAVLRGSQEALDRLVTANLRFVVSVAKQYQNQGLPLTDLISVGNFGLIKAAKRFDVTRGFRFISYAVWWIRQCMIQALAEEARPVRLPLNRISSLSKISKARAKLEQKLERLPTFGEIAEELELSPEEVRSTLQMSNRHISMDSPFVAGEDNTLLDVLEGNTEEAPDRMIFDESLRAEIVKGLEKLEPRERRVITSYFGLSFLVDPSTKDHFPKTLEEIGEAEHITRERVRQLKENALVKMATNAHYKKLRSYLGE